MTDEYEINIDNGAGCAELWEHTSAMRREDDESDE
jgi:hypothetical protein